MSETNDSDKKSAAGWQDWANRTTAVLAVLAALSSGRWGASNLQAILEQGKVNDTWSYYQASSIKEHSAKQMEGLVKVIGSGEPEARAKDFTQLEQQFASEAADKNTDKKQRFDDANRYQKKRDEMVERGFWFEISFAALQLGVILSTIASAATNRTMWVASMIIGLLGLAMFLNGVTRTVHAPHSWYSGASDDMAYDAKSAAHSK